MTISIQNAWDDESPQVIQELTELLESFIGAPQDRTTGTRISSALENILSDYWRLFPSLGEPPRFYVALDLRRRVIDIRWGNKKYAEKWFTALINATENT